ncbi:MAG: hypothetical protein NUV92_08505 [Ignavibacteria bacterium]|jgi:hypothetical protein|nr:hypothetical protein [Ignavibacteria bacterium]MDH7528998.1 hypothetical protein [Ignavibacteria bacterium]
MKILAIYTDQCYKDASKYNLTKELENLIKKIEVNQTTVFLEKYKSPAVVKRAGAFRFIGYEKIIDDCVIIVFLRVLLKGKSDYDEFCINSNEYCQKLLPDDNWIRNNIQNKIKVINKKPDLNEIELKYLFNPIPEENNGNIIIYESNEFVKDLQNSEYKVNFAELIREILDKKEFSDTKKNHSQKYNLSILFKFFNQYNILFLYRANTIPFTEKDQSEFETLISKIHSIEDIMQKSYRTYPEYILYDDDFWLNIQKDTEGNLALSTEEANIYNSIIHNKPEDPLFPLFINGRAGSGKSTLLYYIFSHIMLNHILQEPKLPNPPLFLTYSPKLMETAKEQVKNILKSNYKIREKYHDKFSDKIYNYINSDDFSNSFKTFRDFQKELLTPEQRHHFLTNFHYDFAKFREDWIKYSKKNPSNNIRKITPEFAWYVIRTFIKGMRTSEDEYLDPNEFKNLPRDMKTIDEDTYKLIYNEVFLRWYKNYLEENKFWDDQDLTRFVLDNQEQLFLDYPAVFCDEAQDFTLIEIELISNLSLFSRRNVEFQDIKRIPLAFAGDPLQTINPTGFKWSTVKSNFYSKINSELDRSHKIPLNYYDLTNNYRSVQPIVTFNNIIQLIRCIIFNIKDIRPQNAWFGAGDSVNPTLLIDEFSVVVDALNDERKNKFIIIPCEENQEKEYVLHNDKLLKEKALINNDLAENIWSPMNVKGLEFNTTIIYNFGDYLIDSLDISLYDFLKSKLEDSDKSLNLDEYKKIQLEYFLNKLYVATSRAKKNLVIVDTNSGYQALWKVFESDLLKDLPKLYELYINDKIQWDENDNISNFYFEKEIFDLSADNPEELAVKFYHDGLTTLNPRKLRTAAKHYRTCNKIRDANKAEAKAYEFENNFLKAAEMYIKNNDFDNAARCLWQVDTNNKYERIIEEHKNINPNSKSIFVLASEFMLNEDKKANSIVFLREFEKIIRSATLDSIYFYSFADKNWYLFYDELLKSLCEYSLENPNLSDWDDVPKIIQNLANKDIPIKNRNCYIDLIFNLKQFKEVIDILNEKRDLENELYVKSCAEYFEYPRNIEYLYRLGEYDKIAKLFHSNLHKFNELRVNELEIIFNSILETEYSNYLDEFIKEINSENLRSIINDQNLERLFKYNLEHSSYQISYRVLEKLEEIRDEEYFVNLIKTIFQTKDKKSITYYVSLLLYNDLIFNRVHSSINILQNSYDSLSFIPAEFINTASLNKILIYYIASIEKFNLKKELREKYQSYVRDFLVNSDKWLGLFNVELAGRAIEKLDYHIFARDFYEKIFKGDFSEEEKLFAKKRWLKVKFKQSKITKDDDAKNLLINDIKYSKRRWELDDIDVEKLPEYPEADISFSINFEEKYYQQQPIKEIPNIELKLTISINGEEIYSIKKLPEKGLIKIENKHLDETSYFKVKSKELNSEEANIKTEILSEDNIQFSLPDWKLIITLIKVDDLYSLSFFYQDLNNKIISIPLYE